MNRLKLACFALVMTLPAPLQAHAFWLEPEDYRLDAGQKVEVDFRIGAGDDEIEPWNLRWGKVVSLRSHHPGGFRDHQAEITETTDTQPGGATVGFERPGTHILAFESHPSFSDLEAERFNPYIEEEGLTLVRNAREAAGTTDINGTELYSRRSKTLIQVGAETTDNVLEPIGQTLEIVPDRNPYALGGDGRLPLRVLFRGRPLEGATVHLTDLTNPDDEVVQRQTDAEGRVAFEITERGRWVADLVWAVPSSDDRAEFDTIFSSLSFGYSDE